MFVVLDIPLSAYILKITFMDFLIYHYLCAFVSVFLHLCLLVWCVCVFLYASVFMSCICVCLCSCIVCVCVCEFVHAYISACVCVCACVRALVCLCVCMQNIRNFQSYKNFSAYMESIVLNTNYLKVRGDCKPYPHNVNFWNSFLRN